MTTNKLSEAKGKLVDERRALYNDLDCFGRMFEREDLETAILYNVEFLDIHLITGEVFSCRLLEMGKYTYYVELVQKEKKRKLLIPKNSIKFVLIRE